MKNFRINYQELPFARPPFSYEFIADRPEGTRWRIHDSEDNAVGSAETEEAAKDALKQLNRE